MWLRIWRDLHCELCRFAPAIIDVVELVVCTYLISARIFKHLPTQSVHIKLSFLSLSNKKNACIRDIALQMSISIYLPI